MSNLLRRLLSTLGNLIWRFLNLGIPLFLVLLLLLGGFWGLYTYTSAKLIRNVGGQEDYDEAMRYIEIKDLVEEYYIGDADRESMGDSAAAAMISGLGDKWSSYMSPDEYRTFQLSSSNEYTGIGLSILKTEGGGFQVTQVNADSPAARGGLGAGMVIVEVDGEKVTDLDADELRTLIRSKLNTNFTLGVEGRKEPIKVDCRYTYVSPIHYQIERTGAGYIKIDNFEAGAAEDCIAALDDLLHQGVTSFVLDLRDNPGGLVSEARTLLDYLLPQGELFVSRDKSGKEISYSSDNLSLRAPMRVLVNAQTFSEAEIFAAVLQEQSWAGIIGEATTGKTRTQQTIELSDGSAIRLSTRTYLTGRGVDISQKGGVVPDTIVYNSENTEDLSSEDTGNGTASYNADAQLREALRQLSMSAVS